MEKISGLIAATFTPFKNDGTLNLKMVPAYAEKLKKDGVVGVFVCGTTGEGMLLTDDERRMVAEAWVKEQSNDFRIIVHVGSTSALQSNKLASHASAIGAFAFGTMGPLFLPPNKVEDLISFCSTIALGAPELPFYYYHIPTISNVNVSMPAFLNQAEKSIPNLCGLKFTSRNMMEMMQCLQLGNQKWDILHGFDEELLLGLAAGANGAVGSTYNYLAPLYNNIISAFKKMQIEKARFLQYESVKFVDVLIRYGGGVAGGKPVMKYVGIDCGPVRSPVHNLSEENLKKYYQELSLLGLFN